MRKVYAGKAVIAELRGTGANSYDTVTWKASDPVTGAGVSYINDPTGYKGYITELTEPLGQSVELEPPPTEPQPPTYEAYLFSAREAEWQCSDEAKAFYGGFQGLPDHCQNRILMDLNIPLKDTFGWNAPGSDSFSRQKPEGTEVSGPPVLRPARKYSKEEIAEFRRQAADGRFDNEAIPDPSMPSDLAQRLDVSAVGDEPPLSKKAAEQMVAKALPVMQAALGNSRCADWLHSILIAVLEKMNGAKFDEHMVASLKATYSMDSLYSKISEAKKIYEPAKDKNGGTVAEAQEGTQTVTFYRRAFQTKVEKDLSFDGSGSGWSELYDGDVALTLIHEAIHLWGAGFTDETIGEILLKRKVSREAGSNAITKEVRNNCGNFVGRQRIVE
ncbi:MAG: hypothetical protein KF756_11010 [Acidobacteria bacterium]|nr:hypothetical protein [Acidobacteriota bacterium]